MKSRIEVASFFSFFDWDSAKFHTAQRAGDIQPIDVFTQSFDAWQNDWNSTYHSNHCWNRQFIFSIIDLVAHNIEINIVITPRTSVPDWGGEGMDVDLVVHGLPLLE